MKDLQTLRHGLGKFVTTNPVLAAELELALADQCARIERLLNPSPVRTVMHPDPLTYEPTLP